MQSTPIAALVLIVASGASAYLLSRRMSLALGTTTGLVALLVLWQAIEIISVQLAAALQMLGWIARVEVPSIAKYELFLLAGLALWNLLSKPGQMPAQNPSPPKPFLPAYILIAAAALVGSYLAFAVDVFTGFPSGSDSLIYHLPLAVRWLQDGSLAIPASRAWQHCLPANAEIGMMILLSSGKQSMVILASWIPALILTLSTYELGLWVGQGDRLGAILACLIMLSIPMIQFQVFSAYVDLLGSAGILAGFALLLGRPAKTLGAGDTHRATAIPFLAALACGISVGTKPVYYFYALVFSLTVVAWTWVDRKRGTKTLLSCLLLAGLGLLLPSVFWFARGWKQTGNPLFPLEVKIGHRMVFPGYKPSQITQPDFELNFVHKPSQWFLYPWTEWKRSTGYLEIPYGEGEGFGAAFATFVPLGILVFGFESFSPASRRARDWILLLLFIGLVLSWWLWMERVLRFGQVIWVFACVLSVPLIARFEHPRRRSFQLLLIASIAITSAISASVALHLLAGRLRKQLWSRSQIYNYPKFIDQLAPGSRVLNASGEENNFPLAGVHLTNHVIANFEITSELSRESLSKMGADYVVEVLSPGVGPQTFPFGVRLTLLDDELVPTGQDRLRWRIWKVENRN